MEKHYVILHTRRHSHILYLISISDNSYQTPNQPPNETLGKNPETQNPRNLSSNIVALDNILKPPSPPKS
jgi:hypothetical protein